MDKQKNSMDLKEKKRRVSSVDVAREAGVTQSTVSRVFNQSKGVNVSDDTVQRIIRVAEKLNYRPSVLARSLQQKSTNIIGIVSRHFDSPFHTESLNCFSRELQKLGYTTLLLNLSSNSHLDDVLPLALEYQVDGIVLTSVFLTSGLEEDCRNFNTPVIQYNRYSQNQDVDSVCMDNKKAGMDVASYLCEMGHKRISFIAGDASSSTSRDRKSGFVDGLKKNGLSLFSEVMEGFSYYSGSKAAEILLGDSSCILPDAVFCITDMVAAGFMDAARLNYNIRIPEDISVIGFDDIPLASWPGYDLTTVSQPIDQMVIETIRILLESIKYEKDGPTRKLIPGPIVARSTVLDRNM
jgi:DNA-binding LacI/PurR family transcriptional regulator